MKEAFDLINVSFLIGFGFAWGGITFFVLWDSLSKAYIKAILFLKEILNEQKRKKDFGFRS